jgi:hypothetical protein
MKNAFWLALMISGFVYPGYQAFAAEPETKKVCIDKMDKGKPVLDKQGKPVQTCKEVKIHKKLEGTKIEDAKKSEKK